MSQPNQSPTLRWEVRYASDIAGRALFNDYSNETDALAASRWLERNLRRHGLPAVAKTVTVSIRGGASRQ